MLTHMVNGRAPFARADPSRSRPTELSQKGRWELLDFGMPDARNPHRPYVGLGS